MEPIHEVQRLLPSLSRGEKAQVLKWVVQELGDDFPGIDSYPVVCGGDACVGMSRLTVSGLVEWRRLGMSDDQLLADFETLTPEGLAAAWEYAASHEDEIEQAILAEEKA